MGSQADRDLLRSMSTTAAAYVHRALSRTAAAVVLAALACGCATVKVKPLPVAHIGPGATSWTAVIDGASARAVAVDDMRRAIVAGSFSGTVAGLNGPVNSRGGQDGFVTALGPGGAPAWTQAIGGAGADAARAVAVGPSGSVAVAGTFAGRAVVGDRTLEASGKRAGFVAVFARNGALSWARAIPSTDHAALTSVAFADGGVVVVGGYFDGTVTVGDDHLTSAGADDMLVVAFSGDGSPEWARRGGGRGADTIQAVATHGQQVVVAGSFTGTAELGHRLEAAANGQDAFVAMLEADGQPSWAARLGGVGLDTATAVAIIGDTIAVAGSFTTQLQFGDHTIQAAGGRDLFVAAMTMSPRPRWLLDFGGTGSDYPASLTATGDKLLLTGSFEKSMEVGDRTLTSAGRHDAFACSLDAGGDATWVGRLGGTGDDFAGGGAIGPNGAVAFTGRFTGTAAIDGHPLTSKRAGNGATSAFVVMSSFATAAVSSRAGSRSEASTAAD